MNKYSDIMLSLESILRMLQLRDSNFVFVGDPSFRSPAKDATAEEAKKLYEGRLDRIADKVSELIDHCRNYVDPYTAQIDPVAKALQGIERVFNRMLTQQMCSKYSDLKSELCALGKPLKESLYDDIKRLDDLTYSYESPDSHALSR